MAQSSGDTGVIGQVLGGRYRLLAFLGSGRFTNVYVAHDLSTTDQVVVKLPNEDVLPDGWSSEGIYARRFREAAEQAAAVRHRHLVTVHGWGASELGLYVVSEYLDGGSLQQMLDAGNLLSPSQALMVGLELARGLVAVDQHGLVHRDIRPSNIVFDGQGQAHLADLGTSWVMTSSETEEALVARSVFSANDAVRYASPEQAHGLMADHTSDVYSLVLVLTEALSGRVPFDSDDPDYTQMAKMSRPLDLAGQFGRLGRVLEHAARPDRHSRPHAGQLAKELLDSAQSLPPPEPLPLTKRDWQVPEPVGVATPPVEPPAQARPARSRDRRSTSRSTRTSTKRLRWALVAFVLVGAAGFGAYALWQNPFGGESPTVPDLAGADDAALARIQSEFGWEINRLERRQDGTMAGTVLDQDPPPGTELDRGETLTVWVSLGNELVVIPGNLVGLATEDAEALLGQVGLVVGEITRRHDEVIVAGAVVQVDELFSQVEPGAAVDLLVSLGPSPRTVPEVVTGTPLVVAQERLEELRLQGLEWRVPDNQVAADHVVRLEPPPGTEVPADAVITVVVSDGPERVRVPLLATLQPPEAIDLLEEIGLCGGEIDGPPDAEILTSNPPAEAVVDFGTCVDLVTRPDEEPGDDTDNG
ncbi:protein kinase domain-containing protein [Candidatus Poriferisocius sp.]|uniref:protein kinase domain-containing protein n=1 Tax=Candidatus Poriferisocius sp. TaxID=3101276 RepID=UPI003B5A2726